MCEQLTEQQVADLIDWALRYIRIGEVNCASHPGDKSASANLKLLKIALVSLESPTVTLLRMPESQVDSCGNEWVLKKEVQRLNAGAQVVKQVEIPDLEENETAFNLGVKVLIDCLDDCGDAEQGLRLAFRAIRDAGGEVAE